MQLFAAALVVAALTANPTFVAQQGGRLTPVQATIADKITPEAAVMVYQRCAALFSARSMLLNTAAADRAVARAAATATAFRVAATKLAQRYKLDLGERTMDETVSSMIGDYMEEFALSNANAYTLVGALKADHDFCMSLD